MELLLIALIVYLIIGVSKASNHIASGKVGSEGKLMTFLFIMIAWPLV